MSSTRPDRILHHEIVVGDDAPQAWLYVLHGIFGAGRNWASVARRIVAARADWGAVLVDLRQHGASQGFRPPHTIAAAAADLATLAAATGRPARAVLGHSFGGKVALQWVATREPGLEQAWIIDSTPVAGEPRGSAWHMLQTVHGLPPTFGSRTDAVRKLAGLGVAEPVAQWMATNLERGDDGTYAWRFDIDAIEALMRDFFDADLWSVAEAPHAGVSIRFVKATESSILTPEAVRRIETAARTGTNVSLDVLPGGHWLNADNPDGIAGLLEENLPATRS